MPEFLVLASETRTGRPYPPFLIPAVDEQAARAACRRGWLTIASVAPYEAAPGQEKPRLLQWGPPLSDRSFDRDYHNRPADPDQKVSEEKAMSLILDVLKIIFKLFGA